VGILDGRRVVVTRAADQADVLAGLLRMHGAIPVVVPLIEIIPEPQGVAELTALDPDDFDWLVVTSPNAAEAYLTAHHRVPEWIAAVGGTTAATLRHAGHTVALVPTRQRAEGLLEVFPAAPAAAQGAAAGTGRVLLVQAVHAEPVLYDGLLAKGWQVTAVRPYVTVPARPDAGDRHEALSADAVLMASGSAAKAWVTLFGPSSPPVVVIGPQTAMATQRAGLKVAATAADHSLAGLVEALEQYLAGSE
jgi:uroporphyrinogen-III synthase